jgi:hypothetical protein
VSCTETLKAHVSPDVKRQARAVADREFLSEAAWLKRLVLREIRACEAASDGGRELPAQENNYRSKELGGSKRHCKPVFVRFRDEDRLLLDARAAARGMRPATYVSVLTRAHLRSLTPLPKEEYLALKRSIAVLESIGRNLNQIAKTTNQGGRIPDPGGAEFRAMLKICMALRDHTKALLMANQTSWETGHVQADL